jgi:hypothetical protein
MTKEEIIDFCEMKSQFEPENEDIFNYIIKALEQEPILDKIRAEIMAIGNWNTKSELPNGDLEKVLDIIDKYKAESEEV